MKTKKELIGKKIRYSIDGKLVRTSPTSYSFSVVAITEEGAKALTFHKQMKDAKTSYRNYTEGYMENGIKVGPLTSLYRKGQERAPIISFEIIEFRWFPSD